MWLALGEQLAAATEPGLRCCTVPVQATRLAWRGQPKPAAGVADLLQRKRPLKKTELPIKTCATCGLPFTWRKKWARCWDEVRYCSQRCRQHKRPAK
jgi:hypothetical protein